MEKRDFERKHFGDHHSMEKRDFEHKRSGDRDSMEKRDFERKHFGDHHSMEKRDFERKRSGDRDSMEKRDFEHKRSGDRDSMEKRDFERKRSGDHDSMEKRDFERKRSGDHDSMEKRDFEHKRSGDRDSMEKRDFERKHFGDRDLKDSKVKFNCEWSSKTARPWTKAQHEMCCGKASGIVCRKDAAKEVKRAAALVGCVRALFKQDRAVLAACCARHMIGCRAKAEQACFGTAIDAAKKAWCCRVHGQGCADGCDDADATDAKKVECCKERGTHCAVAQGERRPQAPRAEKLVAADAGSASDASDASAAAAQAGNVVKRLRMKVRGSMADVVENPKRLHLQMKLRLLRAVRSLRTHPDDVRIARLGALMKGGAMPGADKAAAWTVDVPEAWDVEIEADVHAVSAAWSAVERAQRGAAALEDDAAADAGDEGVFFEAVITKQTDADMAATVDEVKKMLAAGEEFEPIGSGVEEVGGQDDEDRDEGVAPWMLGLSAAAASLCVGLVVLGVMMKKKSDGKRAEQEAYGTVYHCHHDNMIVS